nr:metalloregulator ArsR/SmtB family transcription factor [uncultured Cohaesibacter sp.]
MTMVDETDGRGQGCCGDARPEGKADGFCCGADITSEMGPHIELARAFKALAHPARLMILSKLGSHQHCCGDICSSLPLAQSTVSQHLKVLRECGFIEWETAGQHSHYRVNSDKVSWFLSQSATFFAEG